jgi:hypothetical protein
MPQIGRAARLCFVGLLATMLASCGRSAEQETALAAAPVRQVAASLARNPAWAPGRCLCAGHFRDEGIEDFPPGLIDGEYARYPFLRKWSECAPYYGRVANFKGCEKGMTDFICSVADREGLPKGTARVLCHVNGESEAMRKAGYLQDEYDVTEKDGALSVKPVSLKGSGKINE